MKRFEQKVRDIVDVRAFANLLDYGASPDLTVEGYHFTDMTADLMSTWLDTIARLKPTQGAALALAGFRGVGKSHFIATFGALLSNPDLRSKVSDSHVEASAQRLTRRHYTVGRVQRGTDSSLLLEFKATIAGIVGVDPATLSDTIADLFLRAKEKCGDIPLVMLVDTALDRASRVTREDGSLLADIAETAIKLGIFVGIALDDDIAGADGVNASIARTFTIHFLDQEHLYKIVDTAIFPKHDQMRPVLHEIYESYRDALPGFRWSEPRFTALYPLHPSIMELAPYIRLYLQDFALLGFAADAGVRIMGRPANSLIALDEVFDSVEKELRRVDELSEIFACFDDIDRELISKIPVMKRLRAKLVLKGLLLASLDDDGTSAADLCASLLIIEEDDPATTVREVEELLQGFVAALPDSVSCVERAGRGLSFAFKRTGKDDLNTSLIEAIGQTSLTIVPATLRRLTADKYSDLVNELDDTFSHACAVVWRGNTRRGRLRWVSDDEPVPADPNADWSVIINDGPDALPTGTGTNLIEWRMATLRPDEIDTLRRYYLLRTDEGVRERYGNQLAAAIQGNSIAVDKIWRRVMLDDAVLVFAGLKYQFGDDAHAAHTVSQLLTGGLEAIFDEIYPLHPYFASILEKNDLAVLIGDFFGGGRANFADVQKLAEVFALPLGLVVRQGDVYVTAPADAIMELPFLRDVFRDEKPAGSDVIALSRIAKVMGGIPYGLCRESQYLILAALVAQRRFEFVTISGNRISWRSLDLQIIWDDIVGLAAPDGDQYSSERLLTWASILTGTETASLDTPEGKARILEGLSAWLDRWGTGTVLEQFASLPDGNLNSMIWRKVSSLRKSYDAVAASVRAVVRDDCPLDQCLNAIADTFSDSEAEYADKERDLASLSEFTRGAYEGNKIADYLSRAEMTDRPEIEQLRNEILVLIEGNHIGSPERIAARIESAWSRFLETYSVHYHEKHDATMRSVEIRDRCAQLMRSDEWFEFENLAQLALFDERHYALAIALVRESRQMGCSYDTGVLLSQQPACNCAFSFSRTLVWMHLPERLETLVKTGLESYRTTLTESREELSDAISKTAQKQKDPEVRRVAGDLRDRLGRNDMTALSADEIAVLAVASKDMTSRSAGSGINGGDPFPIDGTLAEQLFSEDHVLTGK